MHVTRYVGLATIAAGLASTVLVPSAVSARTQPAAGGSPQARVQVVADNLNTPRGLVYDAQHHRILVAEAGTASGDTGPCGIGEGGGKLCFGNTGSILAYNTVTGRSHEFITGLPSESLLPAGSAVLGLEALSLFHGQLNGVWGLLGTPNTRTHEGPGAAALGQVAHISPTGALTPYGDIARFEIKTYGKGQESDPYDLITGPYGTVVANAGGHAVQGNIGGNDLLLVNPQGQVSQLAAFAQRIVGTAGEIESVPTSVAQGPDGAYYVGELEGFPYPPGAARIWKVVPGHGKSVFARGFTNIISLTFDHEGNLIVLEIARKGLTSSDQQGALIKVSPSGEKTVLATTGLTNPGGVVEVGNAFYVTNFTTSAGGVGQLLKITVPEP